MDRRLLHGPINCLLHDGLLHEDVLLTQLLRAELPLLRELVSCKDLCELLFTNRLCFSYISNDLDHDISIQICSRANAVWVAFRRNRQLIVDTKHSHLFQCLEEAFKEKVVVVCESDSVRAVVGMHGRVLCRESNRNVCVKMVYLISKSRVAEPIWEGLGDWGLVGREGRRVVCNKRVLKIVMITIVENRTLGSRCISPIQNPWSC
mmetsp:Transcript_44263/g.65665  ORF Transcript_44263/g.65665 Transcript_44263/m.65665 type:complete len:206 (+) Transcript_44263:191-808(+)